MASGILSAKFTGFVTEVPAIIVKAEADYRSVYEANRVRIYNLAFYATDNELTAEEISTRVFARAFSQRTNPSTQAIDDVLISELRELMPVGALSLNDSSTCTEAGSVRGNVKRVLLERAVVQLPATEKLVFLLHDVEGYGHERIAGTLGISQRESEFALHQARICLRKVLASTK